MKILITGSSGIGGVAVVRELLRAGYSALRCADIAPPAEALAEGCEFVRCDTRTPGDVERAVAGCEAVIHLAAWHCGHTPPVSDDTIFAVNVDGTYNVVQTCRKHGVKALIYASSMAYGRGSVYSITKVLGEELCRMFHETTGMAAISLRYHAFTPRPYLEFGNRLLFNGVDRRDVATATVASLKAALAGNVKYFMTVVHHALGAPPDVVADFANKGPAWLEPKLPGSTLLIQKYALKLPQRLEQHDLTEAASVLQWTPRIDFLTFLRDLQSRDARGEDVSKLHAAGELPE